MHNKITITISGLPNSGKTTLAELIFATLHKAGIDPTVVGYDGVGHPAFEQRLSCLAGSVDVTIVEQQLQHEPL